MKTLWQLREGWVAVLAAAFLYALACPPYEISLVAWLVPGLLLTGVRGLSKRAAFARGVVFALVFGYGMTSWAVGASLEYFGFSYGVAWLFAAGVWLACGFPYALLTVIYAWASEALSARSRPVLAAWLWVGAELLRTELFSGMPWELLGHTQFRNTWVIQVADLGGVYAVSFVMVLVSVGVAELLSEGVRSRVFDWRRLAMPIAAMLCLSVYGYWSLAQSGGDVAGANTSVAVVQGNVENSIRWKRAHFERALAAYTELSESLADAAPDLIVWPENAVSFYVDREPAMRRQLGVVAKWARKGLIFGAPRYDRTAQVARNSAYWMGPTGNIDGYYDKQKLVPFAEYDPLGGESDSDQIVYRGGDEPGLLDPQDMSVGAVICYEIIFPSLVRELVRDGARLLVNLSNDSWMDVGDGVAPRQHASMAVFRAVETRRYLVRASAGGYSGFVDPYGRLYATLPNRTADYSLARVGFRDEITPYVRWGDRWATAGATAGLLLVIGAKRSAT